MRGGELEALTRKSAEAQSDQGLHLLQTSPRFAGRVEKDGQAVGRFVGRGGLDFIGDLRGRFVTFDCKSTKTRSSFPLDNLTGNQVVIVRNCHERGALGFFLLELAPSMSPPAYFALTWPVLKPFWMPYRYGSTDDTPASIPREVLERECLPIPRNRNHLDLVSVIEPLLLSLAA